VERATLIHVFNKMDLVPEAEAFRRRAAAAFEPAVFVSAAHGEVRDLVKLLADPGPERVGLQAG
jgi:50S ribosomal subunit-associated GTPase HflX